MSQATMPSPATMSGGAYPPPQQPQRSMLGPCLIGCGVVSLLVLLACGGTVWWVSVNAKRIATDLIAGVLKESIKQSQMREEDKQAVVAQIDRVADGFKQGKINEQELGKIMEGMAKSPLMMVLIVYGVTYDYINRPGQDADVKVEAERTLQRTARDTAQGTIKEEDLKKPFSSIAEDPNQQVQPGQPPQPKQQLTDEDLKKFLEDLKTLADEKAIPDEPYELNVGKEIKRIVDEAVPGKL